MEFLKIIDNYWILNQPCQMQYIFIKNCPNIALSFKQMAWDGHPKAQLKEMRNINPECSKQTEQLAGNENSTALNWK